MVAQNPFSFTPAHLLPFKNTVTGRLVYPAVPAPGGWHAVLGLTLIPLALVLIVFIFMAKESPTRPQGIPVLVYLRALKKADIWWFCLLYSITFGGFVGLGSYLTSRTDKEQDRLRRASLSKQPQQPDVAVMKES